MNCIYSAQGFIICNEHFEQKEEYKTKIIQRTSPIVLNSNTHPMSVNNLCKNCNATLRTSILGIVQCKCKKPCPGTREISATSINIPIKDKDGKNKPLSLYFCNGSIIQQECPAAKCDTYIEQFKDLDLNELQTLTTNYPNIAQTFTPVITQEKYNVSQEKQIFSVPPKPDSMYSIPKHKKQEFTLL